MRDITAIQELLTARRVHERRGCIVSASGLIDGRCCECKAFDALIADHTKRGWAPTTYDRRFLKSLRISAA